VALQAMRFYLINIPARVIGRSRQLSLRLNAGDYAYGWLVSIRTKIAGLLRKVEMRRVAGENASSHRPTSNCLHLGGGFGVFKTA
jgi:hypothetical protein